MNDTVKRLENVKGLLSDIDGTLYFKDSPIPGAIKTISKLRQAGIKFLLFTNTDSKKPKTIFTKLIEYGFSVKEDEIFTPIIALKRFLSMHREKTIFLVATKEIDDEFNEFNKVKGNQIPDYVIIADFRDNWDVHQLNLAFKYILKGAQLYGTQGNKYFLDHKGDQLLDNLNYWLNLIRENTDNDIPIYIVGSSTDLKNRVDYKEIINFIENNDLEGFYLISAQKRTRDSIILNRLAKKILENIKLRPKFLSLEDNLEADRRSLYHEFINFFAFCPICGKENHKSYLMCPGLPARRYPMRREKWLIKRLFANVIRSPIKIIDRKN